MGKQFFTSKEATRIIGCSIRQLQYWRDKGVVVPTISGTGTGRSIYYNYSDLVDLAIMKHGLDMGLSFDTARKCLAQLRDGQPDYINPETKTQLMLYWNQDSDCLKLAEYDRNSAIALLDQGKLVIPLQLDEIHSSLMNQLNFIETMQCSTEQNHEKQTELSENEKKLINEIIAGILKGQKRLLAAMEPGSGTYAGIICLKLFQIKWNTKGEDRSPKILCLTNSDDKANEMKNQFVNLFDKKQLYKIQEKANKGKSIYFASYNAIANDQNRPNLYQAYRTDYFDLMILEGFDQSPKNKWQPILEYFEPAYQLAFISTSSRESFDYAYEYFGNPIYRYSREQAIEDG